MNARLRVAGLWSGAALLALVGHVAAGFWIVQVKALPREGAVDAFPVEIVLEPAPDIPPEVPPQVMPGAASPPEPDSAPDLTSALDAAPPSMPANLPEPDLAGLVPDHEPAPPPPPVLPAAVTEPGMGLAALPPEMSDTFPMTRPFPDAVAIATPPDMASSDSSEALPEIQPPPEPEPELISESAVALALRPPARPARPAPQATAPRAAQAPATEQAPAATPAPAAAPAPAAPSPGEVRTWRTQVQRNITRHMQRTRLPAGRGQVQASLSISVAASGAASARLAASTGNPDVDAALQRQAASLPALPPPPGGQGVTLSVPVVVAF